MQSTQLICPHCGSTLTFGMKIAAGAAVQCLICTRAFKATNPITVAVTATPNPIPKAGPAPRTKRPSESVQAAKPTKPAPTVRPPVDSGPNVGLIAVTIVLLLLLTGGIGFGLWQAGVFPAGGSGGTDGPQIAKNDLPIIPKEPKIIPVEKKNSEAGGGKPLVENDDDDDDIRAKLREETKHVLKRRVSAKAGSNDPEWETAPPEPLPIVGLDEKKINRAIERGIAFLKKTQDVTGTWQTTHETGHAGLCGLTLLECKVPAADPTVQRAAAFVRSKCATLVATYEMSLAILFLDRLGDPRDRPVIYGLGLQLMAGQIVDGGWGYNCDTRSPQDMHRLFGFLRSKNQVFDPGALPKKPIAKNGPFWELSQLLNANPAPVTPLEMLPAELQNRPIVLNKGRAKGKLAVGGPDALTDNSNTQFAMLALWAARRHGVPTDQALLASYQRFTSSQNSDHGWGYPGASTTTMTCAGLIGLGIGHGAAPEIVGVDPDNPKAVVIKPALQDDRIQNALQVLARSVGQPSQDAKKTNFQSENLYFLWSLERVAMLYDLQTIGGKDWYGWGAQMLVHTQQPNGAWQGAAFHGHNASVDTCFALLFLRRSNLVQDLTKNLRLNTGIREPQ